MKVVCRTFLPNEPRQICLVFESIDENENFWTKYISEVERSSAYLAVTEGTGTEGAVNGKATSPPSDLRVAVDGFKNALKIAKAANMTLYVAYATAVDVPLSSAGVSTSSSAISTSSVEASTSAVDGSASAFSGSASTVGEFKNASSGSASAFGGSSSAVFQSASAFGGSASRGGNYELNELTIQMCMTVSATSMLPFTTHMGIFANPLMPAENKISQLSLLLHCFAFQACTMVVASGAKFMVTKPLASMKRIFDKKGECSVRPTVLAKNESSDWERFTNARNPNIGYYIDNINFNIEIGILSLENSLTLYKIKRVRSPEKKHQQEDPSLSIQPVTLNHVPMLSTPSAASSLSSSGQTRGLHLAHPHVENKGSRKIGIFEQKHQQKDVLPSAQRMTLNSAPMSSTSSTASSELPSVQTRGLNRVHLNSESKAPSKSAILGLGSRSSNMKTMSAPQLPNSMQEFNIAESHISVFAPYIWELAFNPGHSNETVFIKGTELSNLYKIELEKVLSAKHSALLRVSKKF